MVHTPYQERKNVLGFILKQNHQEVKNLVTIKSHIVGKENKINMSSFQNINFFDIFEAMDSEHLVDMVINDPKQLKRMCTFLTIDYQVRKEGIKKSGEKIITD
jgi:hypothetical protein|tara:strand:- start:82 stop:390 length:309 start_codon:yes stop_codon:yes gene_type:complete